MGITNKTVSDLFGLAAGRCSICKIPVVQREVKIGEMAHIIAKRKRGARGGLPVQGDINGYENLILLCPNHHTEVDNNEALYPPEELHRIKDAHEAYVHSVFNHQSQARVMDLGGLTQLMRFLPFTQIQTLLSGLPSRFDMGLFYVDKTCENFGYDFPQCRPFFDQYLEHHFLGFWTAVRELNNFVRSQTSSNSPLYDAGDNLYSKNLYLCRELSYEIRQSLIQEVQQLGSNLISSHNAFLQYVRNTYPEVNLASFVGW